MAPAVLTRSPGQARCPFAGLSTAASPAGSIRRDLRPGARGTEPAGGRFHEDPHASAVGQPNTRNLPGSGGLRLPMDDGKRVHVAATVPLRWPGDGAEARDHGWRRHDLQRSDTAPPRVPPLSPRRQAWTSSLQSIRD